MDISKIESQGELKIEDSNSLLELQRLLKDERARGNKHKINYLALKSNLESAEDEINHLKLELVNQKSNCNMIIDNYKTKLSLLEKENQDKSVLINKMKIDLKQPYEVELIVLQAKAEAEKPLLDKIDSLEIISKELRKDLLMWKHENEVLTLQNLQMQSNFNDKMKELELRYASNVRCLEEYCEKLIPSIHPEKCDDGIEKKDESLVEIIKQLEKKLANLDLMKSSLQQEYDLSKKSWSKQLILHDSDVEEYKGEITRLKCRINVLEKESELYSVDKTNLETSLHACEMENVEMKLNIEKFKQVVKFKESEEKIKVSEIELKCKKELVQLNSLVKTFQTEANVKDDIIINLRKKLQCKDSQLSKVFHDLKDLTASYSVLSEEYNLLKKNSLEKQVESISPINFEDESSVCKACENLKESLANKSIEASEQLKIIHNLTSDLEAEKIVSLKLKHSLKLLKDDYEACSKEKEKMASVIIDLNNANASQKTSLLNSLNEHERSTKQHEMNFAEMTLKHGEEVIHLKHRISELETIIQSQNDLKEDLSAVSYKLQRYRKLIKKLRSKIKLKPSSKKLQLNNGNSKIIRRYKRLQERLIQMTVSQKQFHDILMNVALPVNLKDSCIGSNEIDPM